MNSKFSKPNYNFNKNTKNVNNNKKANTNIIINTAQTKNPAVKDFFFNYKTDDSLVCDFKINEKYFCYFLSLKYHEKYPTYIEERLNKTTIPENNIFQNQSQPIKFLFLLYDDNMDVRNDEEFLQRNLEMDKSFIYALDISLNNLNESENVFIPNSAKKPESNNDIDNKFDSSRIEKIFENLNMLCINTNTALILCYSNHDIAQYVYSLSQLANVDNIKDNKRNNAREEETMIETLCMIEGINNKEATSLLSNFQSVRSIFCANNQLLSHVPGINDKKIKKLNEFLTFDFKNLVQEKERMSTSNILNSQI